MIEAARNNSGIYRWAFPVVTPLDEQGGALPWPERETRGVTVRLPVETFVRLKSMGLELNLSLQSMLEAMIEGTLDKYQAHKDAQAKAN